jgi:phosphoribosylglycinamide formyltransferase-1
LLAKQLSYDIPLGGCSPLASAYVAKAYSICPLPSISYYNMTQSTLPHIAIFASGTGSNAVKIIEQLQGRARFTVLSNKADAGVLPKAEALGVRALSFSKKEFQEGHILRFLQAEQVELIVLAGFLWLIPPALVAAYPNRIINIHPSLLPKYGGKGMYGMHVHEAVKNSGDTETGITIHFVNEHYDEGQIILQAKVAISENDAPEAIAKKVQVLEHRHFPEVVMQLLNLGA